MKTAKLLKHLEAEIARLHLDPLTDEQLYTLETRNADTLGLLYDLQDRFGVTGLDNAITALEIKLNKTNR